MCVTYLYLKFTPQPIDAFRRNQKMGLVQIHYNKPVSFVKAQNELFYRRIATPTNTNKDDRK